MKPAKQTILILGGLAALLLLYLGLRLMVTSTTLSAEWKLALLFGMALLFLFIGLAGLDLALRRLPRRSQQELSLPAVFVLAYGLPGVVFLLPLVGRVPFFSFPEDGFTWYFLWQALFMGAYQLNRLRKQVNSRGVLGRLPGALLPGFMTGLGLWLAAVFLYSLFTASSPLVISLPLPRFLQVVMLIATLGVAPWAEEAFFRRQLLVLWQPRLGELGASLLVALVFASLQMRPLMWLPAFLFSLGVTELARRTRSLLAPALAHLVFNGLMVILGWNAVL